MDGNIQRRPRKATFRRLDKYLYVARHLVHASPAEVVAVCVMHNSGRSARVICQDLELRAEAVKAILGAAEPFLRKRRAKA